jgi:RNA polymerase sigma factor (sigma-70 family)
MRAALDQALTRQPLKPTQMSTQSNLPDNPSLVAQLRPALLQYFRRKTGSIAEAEDLTQEVLVRALTHANWKSAEQAKGYIFRIAMNCWHDRQRRLQAHGSPLAYDELNIEHTGVETPPESVLMIREELSQLACALEQMNERTRAVLMLIKLEKMRAASVAEMLGISVSAVNKHLARGLAQLAELRKRQDELQ